MLATRSLGEGGNKVQQNLRLYIAYLVKCRAHAVRKLISCRADRCKSHIAKGGPISWVTHALLERNLHRLTDIDQLITQSPLTLLIKYSTRIFCVEAEEPTTRLGCCHELVCACMC